jgi:SM-20-related protein
MPSANFFVSLGLFAVPNFLEPTLCTSLRSEMAAATRAPATVRDAGDVYDVDQETRRTKTAKVAPDTAGLVEQRLLGIKPELEEHFAVCLTGLQGLQFLVYTEGDFFRRHVDQGSDEDDAAFARARRVSVVIFLNDEASDPAPDAYGGGALTFYGLLDSERGQGIGLPLTAEPGLLVAFPAATIHEVTPVTHGERYTAVTWFV